MIDSTKPLYSLTVGEFVELLNATITEIDSKKTKEPDTEVVDKDATLNIKELAEFLGCSTVTISSHRKKGWLPRPYQVGRKIIWRKAEILEFLKQPLNRRKVRI